MPAKCKTRERIAASGNEDIPTLPVGAVRGRLCFRCFVPTDKILKCGACKRAGYCSRECQKLDWSAVHKKQCKVLQQVNEAELQDYKEKRTWNEYRASLLQYVRSIRDTTSATDAVFIVQAQSYCSTCYRSFSQLASRGVSLKACNKCQLVHHCRDCQDSHSEAHCAAYQKQNEIEQFRIELFEDTGRASVIECTQTPRSDYKTLQGCTGWYDYFTTISDKAYVRDSITSDFSSISESVKGSFSERAEFEERRRMFLLLATENLTMPLTILSALEDLNLVDSNSLKIHLLGATSREFLSLSCFEELLHLVPTLTTLAMTAVGPSSMLFGPSAEDYSPQEGLPCCPSCQSKARTRTISSYRGLYHDFAKSNRYEKPDLIVAFNSGFVDGDDADTDWIRTIRLIVESDMPALFTTCNSREAHNEWAKMKSLGARFVVEPSQNIWKSLVPMPEFLDEEYGFWYQNDHRYIVQGRT